MGTIHDLADEKSPQLSADGGFAFDVLTVAWMGLAMTWSKDWGCISTWLSLFSTHPPPFHHFKADNYIFTLFLSDCRVMINC